MNNTLIKKFEIAVFYILSAIIIVYIAVEIIELIYQFGKALLTTGDTTTRLLIIFGKKELIKNSTTEVRTATLVIEQE